MIDPHVHLRDWKQKEKETLKHAFYVAREIGLAGLFEMPNTSPSTTTPDLLVDKVKRGTDRMHCDFAFYAGATKENGREIAEMEQMRGCCGVKVFMGASTGDLLVDTDEGVANVLNVIKRRAAFHISVSPPSSANGRPTTMTAGFHSARIFVMACQSGLFAKATTASGLADPVRV